MLIKFTYRSFIQIIIIILQFCCTSEAQVINIRPYSQVYSENLRGSCIIFGNTSMHIVDADTVSTSKINETADPTNPFGGLGYSQFGNDFENMQFADIDITASNAVLFEMGSTWKYLANGIDQGRSWRLLNNPDIWPSGSSSFGYGHAQTTTIPSGHITTYFLKTVNITDPALFSEFDFTYSYDDGIAFYVNGTEVTRENLPAGNISFGTPASSINYTLNSTFSIPSTYFIAGDNIIAVEIHQNISTSSNCYFDMALKAKARSTINSSSANLLLPAGTNTIKFARLYWGGRIADSTLVNSPDTLRTIRIRKGTSGSYSPATAPATNVDTYAVTLTETIYQAYVDVTSFIQNNGAGTYTVADIPSLTGSNGDGGNYAGWSIVVAYENTSLNYNSVRIYDGYSRVYDFGIPVTQQITLTGLNVPNNPLTSDEAVMSTMVWEGDANLFESLTNPSGDYLKLNNIFVSNAVNPVSNFWNGSISKNGAFVTGNRNPDHFNQMGIDIDEMNVGTGYNILPDATTVTVEFGTEADQYFPSIFAFSIRMKEPQITLDKTVHDANNSGFVDANEILTYTLSGINTGTGIAFNTYVVDSLPSNVSYVPNSLEVVNAPGVTAGIKTDASDSDDAFVGTSAGRTYLKFFIGNNWTSSAGGELPPLSSYILRFKVKVGSIAGSVTNTARITSNSQAGDLFVDDGTAVISPDGGPIPIKFSSFTAVLSGNNGRLEWTTEFEFNNDHFEIERSYDAITFANRGVVASSGNSSIVKHYSYIDPINRTAGIIYYRLKIVDHDGMISYSKIIALKLNGSTIGDFAVYPNPFQGQINVLINSIINEDVLFKIITSLGRELVQHTIQLQKGENVVVLKNLQAIPAGIYILEATTTSGKQFRKIIKR